MDVRAQVSVVFHLDKCIGCHTCSIACKNVWTDRKGAEYMWWNNVETKPGTGYPTAWENQEDYKGGWVKKGNSIELKGAGKLRAFKNIFHNPNLPTIDDYYEPWTYRYEDLFNSPEGDTQPVARPVSLLTGKFMEIKAGPNWDDDLSGSPDYARKDPNFKNLSQAEQEALFQVEKLVMFYLPRICNHCLNPACLAACPSGAIYKRGEDGVVLINQKKCRAWRMCVTACPYKKTYYNWSTGKSEKCILCYPRLETGQAPACMHSCVGRIRYLGMMLYDADLIHQFASADESKLLDLSREIILDPRDPKVIEEARKNGIHDSVIEYAQRSPVYRFVKEWGLALPLHPEYRTLPMLFYVPPLLPIMGMSEEGVYESLTEGLFTDIEQARLPIQYLASLFTAGNEGQIREVLKKMMAVRLYRREETVGDLGAEAVQKALKETGTSREQAEAIYRLTSLANFEERFVIPPSHREEAIVMLDTEFEKKGTGGFGFRMAVGRGL
ncbi:MAG: nitrate reductase subunit beta [Deltaproteobacteria bacterium]|nr:nitrate reductase subunit beta [Deltaproteobacteria bacterium]